MRGEGVVDAVADGVAQLGLGHAAVQGEGGDEVDVVDAGRGGQVEHRLDDPLADVGPAHRRQRQRDVVEGDRELHARAQQRGQRLAVAERVSSSAWRMAASGSSSGLERLGRVDDPACGRRAASRAGSPRRGGRGSAGSSGRPRGRTRDGASDGCSPSRSPEVEGDLDGAAGAGGGGVVDGVLVAAQGIGGADTSRPRSSVARRARRRGRSRRALVGVGSPASAISALPERR